MDETARTQLAHGAGLCGRCRHAAYKPTRRGTIYLRCTRAGWDDRLVKYPPLPVRTCVGHDPLDDDHTVATN